VNRRRLAYELHRYVAARTRLDPPPEPDFSDPSPPPSPSGGKPAREALQRLAREAKGCERCRLCENRRQVVFGEGTADARLLVIGEAPGAREDEQGRPFVGPAGELLRGGFEKIGLDLEAVYITNTVKCRPPENRNPRGDELQACRSYLDDQLELIDPEVVLTLGNFALRYCLGEDERIGACRGQVFSWQERSLVPTYHPAYILRNRSQAQSFINDLKRAVDQLGNG